MTQAELLPALQFTPPAPAPAETKPVKKAMTITATYNADNGPAIQGLYRQIKALCLTCSAQVREI